MKRTPLPSPLGPEAAGRETRFPDVLPVDQAIVDRLRAACGAVSSTEVDRVEAGRDWWPLSTWWATDDMVPALPAVVCRPESADGVSAVLRICSEAGVPVTPFAGASGVCGGSIPVHGGVSLDMTGLAGIVALSPEDLRVEVRAGTFGPDLEAELRSAGLTLGHWPQSMDLSTVGGWLACRGAGQYSTRYGKIEDMVAGLEVALADGRVIRTGGTGPRAATGPDLTQLFVGSEGTLGVITSCVLRLHPAPPAERRAAYGLASFDSGLEVCRAVMRRGATPAVLRLYDPAESARNFDLPDRALLIVVDEGDPGLIDATMSVVDSEVRAAGGTDLGDGAATRWLERRNHIPPVADLVRGGLVVDTVEIAAAWSALSPIYRDAIGALSSIEGTLAASAHQSHSYTDGACLYFTFAVRPAEPGPAAAEEYYRWAFDAVTAATMAHHGSISHHHGIGLNRARYLVGHLGPAFAVLQSMKDSLDPGGILNPGKLGLADHFGAVRDLP